MKKYLGYLFVFLMFSNAKAQTIFAPQKAVWYYYINADGINSNIKYTTEKDTFYEGKFCSKVICEYKVFAAGIVTKYTKVPTYFYTSGDTVLYYHDSLKSFTALYIFNVKVGDTLQLQNPWHYRYLPKDSTFKLLVTAVDTVIYDGIPLREIKTNTLDGSRVWMPKYTERIGGYSLADIINIDGIKTAMHTEGLRCYSDDEIKEKFVPDGFDCDYLLSVTKTNNLNNSLKIFPNPAHNFITIETTQNSQPAKLSIFGINGSVVIKSELIAHKNTIDIHNLKTGVYFLQIKNETETVFRKLIID